MRKKENKTLRILGRLKSFFQSGLFQNFSAQIQNLSSRIRNLSKQIQNLSNRFFYHSGGVLNLSGQVVLLSYEGRSYREMLRRDRICIQSYFRHAAALIPLHF